LLTCGIFLSATINHGTADQDAPPTYLAPLDAPRFSVESRRGRLVLQGTTASRAHEAGLLQLAADHFGNADTRTSFNPGVILADHWASTSSRLLYALAAMDSAQAVMQDRSIEIRGVTSNAAIFTARLDFVRENLRPDIPVDADIVIVDSVTPLDDLCEHTFSQLVFEPVSFEHSSAEIRTTSFVTLDRITEFAHDCRHATILIAGHTDSSGDESWNRQLSLARAQAVAKHIAQNGIEPKRLLATGLGSSEPVAENDTAQGRSLNRRIEFDLQ
jgi:OOP family OmpA-OmpF porin